MLNACKTEQLARALLAARACDAVVYWSTVVEDRAGAAFAEGFYAALRARPACADADLAFAFEHGRLALGRTGGRLAAPPPDRAARGAAGASADAADASATSPAAAASRGSPTLRYALSPDLDPADAATVHQAGPRAGFSIADPHLLACGKCHILFRDSDAIA